MEFLVRELAELREMLVGMKRTVTGHGLEEKGGETGDREVGLEEREKGEGFLAPDKGEIRTEEGKEICAGATLMQALTLGLWMQWPGGPVDLKTYWPPQKLTGPPKN